MENVNGNAVSIDQQLWETKKHDFLKALEEIEHRLGVKMVPVVTANKFGIFPNVELMPMEEFLKRAGVGSTGLQN